MATVRTFAETDRERWDDFVRRSPGSQYGQLIAWKEIVEESFGIPAHYWLAEDAGRIVGVLPVFEKRGIFGGRSLFSAPGGLLAEGEEVAQALLAPARERVRAGGYELLELRDQRTRWAGLDTVTEHVTMELALESDPDVQWKGFEVKLRNQIRKGLKSGFGLRRGREYVGDFYRVMLENMRDLGTPILGPEYYRRILERFGESADLLVIDLGGRSVGGIFLVAHGDALFDPWASSLRRAFAHCPNQVLYWESIRGAILRGFRRFDFGRSQWGSSTFKFKAQWGAKPVPLFYQYVLGRAERVPALADQKHQFDLAVKMWKKLPLPVASSLGRRVKRLFPEAL